MRPKLRKRRRKKMPILRIREIRSMPVEERKKKLDEIRAELVRLKTMVASGGTIENPGRIKELRKTMARILTIERETPVTQEVSK
jgi:large subunit ribosomal protein L29